VLLLKVSIAISLFKGLISFGIRRQVSENALQQMFIAAPNQRVGGALCLLAPPQLLALTNVLFPRASIAISIFKGLKSFGIHRQVSEDENVHCSLCKFVCDRKNKIDSPNELA
jgi:hypothetical protein